jgi:hypothetical protein
MKTKTELGQVMASAEGAALIAGHFLMRHIFRFQQCNWGATEQELKQHFPGDEIVPSPQWKYTYGITLQASPEDVWPWIVQMGQQRGGFYSYEGLENLAGCHSHNTDRIIPEFQSLTFGDQIWLHPKAPPLTVLEVEPNHWLLLGAGAGSATTQATDPQTTWLFYLDNLGDGTTRLVTRGRSAYRPTLKNRVLWGPFFREPIGLVMSQGMMLGIKARVEPAASQI